MVSAKNYWLARDMISNPIDLFIASFHYREASHGRIIYSILHCRLPLSFEACQRGELCIGSKFFLLCFMLWFGKNHRSIIEIKIDNVPRLWFMLLAVISTSLQWVWIHHVELSQWTGILLEESPIVIIIGSSICFRWFLSDSHLPPLVFFFYSTPCADVEYNHS